MSDPKRPRIPAAEWERNKDLIRRLYVEEGKALPEVMQRMAMNPIFVDADQNMYKRRIHKWGFAVKNHRLSNIESAIQARQRCLEQGEKFRGFERPGYKPISSKEIKRYVRRKQMKVDKGILIPRTPIIKGPENVSASMYNGGSQTPESEAKEVALTALTQRFSPANNRVQLAPPLQKLSQGQQCLCLRCCQERYHVSHREWVFVRPADLKAPDLYQGPEDAFSAFKFALQSSYSAGHWRINEYDHVYGTGRTGLDIDVCGFQNFFLEVDRLYQAGDICRARQIFEKALCVFNQYLIHCLPRAINALQYTVLGLLDRGRSNFVFQILKSISAMCSQNTTNKALQVLFYKFYGLDPDALRDVILRFCDIESDFIETSRGCPSYAHFYPRLLAISRDNTIGGDFKRTKIFSMVDGVNQDTIQGQAAVIACWGWMVKENLYPNETDRVRALIQNIRRLAETRLLDDYFYVWAISEAFQLLSWTLRDTGKIQEAIDAQEYSIGLVKTTGASPSIRQLRALHNLRKSLGKNLGALSCAMDIRQTIDAMTKLNIQCVRCGNSDGTLETSNQTSQKTSLIEQDLGVNYSGEDDCKSKKTNATEPSVSTVIWKEGLTTTQQEKLTLTVPDWDDDMDIFSNRAAATAPHES